MTSYGFKLWLDENECQVVEDALRLLIKSCKDAPDVRAEISRIYAQKILDGIYSQQHALSEQFSSEVGNGKVDEPKRKFGHVHGVTVDAVFSNCNKYRYKLTVTRDGSTHPKRLCVIMQNPSVASSLGADQTIQRLERLVFEKKRQEFEGVGVIDVVNLFAHVQTMDFSGGYDSIGPDNDAYVKDAIRESDIVLVAWGKTCAHPKRIEAINNLLSDLSNSKVLLQTDRHPSRMSYSDSLAPYSI